MFQLINDEHKILINNIINQINNTSLEQIANELDILIQKIRADIPEKKRISYGRYSIIKKMGLVMYPMLENAGIDAYKFAKKIYDDIRNDQFVRSFAMQLISIYGEKTKDLENVLADFERAATDEQWEARECSAGFIRKCIVSPRC